MAPDLRGRLGGPLDDASARDRGGRWNPPGSWRTLYLNEDVVTARLNVDRFIGNWPYEPEDLRADAGPHLAVARLPRNQTVADAHTPRGVDALGLPATSRSRAHLVERLEFAEWFWG